MLVLSRGIGEVVVIGHNIRVVVCDAEKGRVRLGFEAPPEVPIHRLEIEHIVNRKESEEWTCTTY